MRICIDIDGVVCQLKKEGQTYADVMPVEGAVEKIKSFKDSGHHIILFTARHMKTCGGNPSLSLARIGKITLDWLDKYQVPYDEINFGKPWADVYIDDNAFRFKSWAEIDNDGKSLPVSNEKSVRGDE